MTAKFVILGDLSHFSYKLLQDIVKSLFSDKAFNAEHHLGAINSINWARILAQAVYYFLAYFQVSRSIPNPNIQFVVPTGNFGDILAGYYAKQMGLPIGKLVIATNENDILARFWKSGRYEKSNSNLPDTISPSIQGASDGKQGGGVKETLSPAMDILVSSNFERLLWYLANEEANDDRRKACSTVAGWMGKVKENGTVEVPSAVLASARRDFLAERITDEQVKFDVATHNLTSLLTMMVDFILHTRNVYSVTIYRRSAHSCRARGS